MKRILYQAAALLFGVCLMFSCEEIEQPGQEDEFIDIPLSV
jgi:hypothetical protein